MQERAERTRTAILDGTIQYILEHGLEGSSVKHIAEIAGVTWGVVQYHFGDREGLLLAVVGKGLDELVAALQTIPRAIRRGDAEQRVRAVVEAAWTWMSSPTSRAAIEILIGTRATRGASAKKQIARLTSAFDDLARSIDDRLDTDQTQKVGNLLLTNLRGLVTTQLIMSRALDTTNDREILVEVITRYIETCDPARDSRAMAR